MSYADKQLTCQDCGTSFTFSADDQQYHAEQHEQARTGDPADDLVDALLGSKARVDGGRRGGIVGYPRGESRKSGRPGGLALGRRGPGRFGPGQLVDHPRRPA